MSALPTTDDWLELSAFSNLVPLKEDDVITMIWNDELTTDWNGALHRPTTEK